MARSRYNSQLQEETQRGVESASTFSIDFSRTNIKKHCRLSDIFFTLTLPPYFSCPHRVWKAIDDSCLTQFLFERSTDCQQFAHGNEILVTASNRSFDTLHKPAKTNCPEHLLVPAKKSDASSITRHSKIRPLPLKRCPVKMKQLRDFDALGHKDATYLLLSGEAAPGQGCSVKMPGSPQADQRRHNAVSIFPVPRCNVPRCEVAVIPPPLSKFLPNKTKA